MQHELTKAFTALENALNNVSPVIICFMITGDFRLNGYVTTGKRQFISLMILVVKERFFQTVQNTYEVLTECNRQCVKHIASEQRHQ